MCSTVCLNNVESKCTSVWYFFQDSENFTFSDAKCICENSFTAVSNDAACYFDMLNERMWNHLITVSPCE